MNYRGTFFALSIVVSSVSFAQYYHPEPQAYSYPHSHQLVQPAYELSETQNLNFAQIPQPYDTQNYAQNQQMIQQKNLPIYQPQQNQLQTEPPCAHQQRPLLAQPAVAREVEIPDDQGIGTFPKERRPFKKVLQPNANPQWIGEKWKWDGDGWVKDKGHWSN